MTGEIQNMVLNVQQAPPVPINDTTATFRGTVTDVRADGMLMVQIPKLGGTEAFGPMPTNVKGLAVGAAVLCTAIGGTLGELMVIASADGVLSWEQLPDVIDAPITPHDADDFTAHRTYRVSGAALAAGLHYPGLVAGLLEVFEVDAETYQRYTGDDGRIHIRHRTAGIWTPWATLGAEDLDINDLLGTGAAGRQILAAETTPDVRTIIGLDLVDNTPDMDKPVSTAVADELSGKAPLANPHFIGTVTGISKIMVGLGNVDNTSDANKPVSLATIALLALKAPLNSPAFTGTVTGVTKAMVGLGNADDTSDLAKPLSTAAIAALALKSDVGHVHAAVTTSVNGFMSAADKVKIDAAPADTTAYVQERVPVGTIIMWAGTSVPTGWLKCDGSTFVQATYPALYANLGNSTTLPNLQDRFPIGTSGTKAVKTTGGAATITQTTAQMPSHTHEHPHTHQTGMAIGIITEGSGTQPNIMYPTGGGTSTSQPSDAETDPTGGGNSMNILNPYYSLNFLIRALP